MRLPLSVLSCALLLSACATAPQVPDNAVAATHTESNGDVVTEYRVGGKLRMLEVKPLRGPTYYLYDRNGDGVVDSRDGDNPPQTYFKLFSW